MPLSDVAVRAIRPRERAYKVHDRNGLFLLVLAGPNSGVGAIVSTRRRN
jgi:hypothetical protein